jgi:hypothetical protein
MKGGEKECCLSLLQSRYRSNEQAKMSHDNVYQVSEPALPHLLGMKGFVKYQLGKICLQNFGLNFVQPPDRRTSFGHAH